MALLFVCLFVYSQFDAAAAAGLDWWFNAFFLLLLLLFLTCLQQSPQDGIAVSTKERRPEDGRRTQHNWRPAAGCYNSGWNRTDPWRRQWRQWRQRQRPVLRPVPDRSGPHHQSRGPLQVLPTASLQGLQGVQRAKSDGLIHFRRDRLGLHRLLQDSVSNSNHLNQSTVPV